MHIGQKSDICTPTETFNERREHHTGEAPSVTFIPQSLNTSQHIQNIFMTHNMVQDKHAVK